MGEEPAGHFLEGALGIGGGGDDMDTGALYAKDVI
jgi:hypothetical protein